jgi:DNA polymerase-4
MRRILHVDMDAFFVAVELLRRPDLRGLPVIVGGRGDPRERGVVSTASYEARRYGVHSAMPLRTALRLCPQAVFLPVDIARYERASRRVKRELRRFSRALEDVGLDEAFIDISDLPGEPEDIGRAIKERIKAVTGLTCSIGIGPNKLLAKLATDLGKPDGLTVLTEADIPTRVWPLAVERLLGVGPKTAAQLRRLSVTTIGALAMLPVSTAVAYLGEAHGRYLHQAAHGIDDSPIITRWQPRSFSRQVTFQRDTADRRRILRTLRELCRSAVLEAQERHYLAGTAGVAIRFADFETIRRQMKLAPPTGDAKAIEAAVYRCLARVPLRKKVRLVGVRLGALMHRRRRRSPIYTGRSTPQPARSTSRRDVNGDEDIGRARERADERPAVADPAWSERCAASRRGQECRR